jgi:hypothetical protein
MFPVVIPDPMTAVVTDAGPEQVVPWGVRATSSSGVSAWTPRAKSGYSNRSSGPTQRSQSGNRYLTIVVDHDTGRLGRPSPRS